MPRARKPAAVPGGDGPRIARRERRRERSREEILEAARKVMLRDGLAATTLDAVAREVGLTKATLYYYFPSKDALLFEIAYGTIHEQARAMNDQVALTDDGGAALRVIIRETVKGFAGRLDDFRLVFLAAQMAGPNTIKFTPEQFERFRPLNDLSYKAAAARIADGPRTQADVDPRQMVFLANLAAIGLLTMKGMVESVGDPLKYSDDELIEALARIFEAAARPRAD